MTVLLDVDPDTRLGARARARRRRRAAAPARARPRGVPRRCTRARRALYEELADAILDRPAASATSARTRARAARARAARRRAHGCCGRARRSGDYPVLVGRGLLATAVASGWNAVAARPLALARVLRERRDASRELYGERLGELGGRDRDRAGRAAQDARERRARVARAGRARA